MHGIDLDILLREKIPTCQTLLFSGQALTNDLLVEAEREGYSFIVLAKPVHPSLLLDTTKQLLAEKRSWIAAPVAYPSRQYTPRVAMAYRTKSASDI